MRTLVVVLCVLVLQARAELDKTFCSNHITEVAPTSTWTPPLFKDNFHVVVERKVDEMKDEQSSMETSEIYFSKAYNTARLTADTKGAVIDMWALGTRNAAVEIQRNIPTGTTCPIKPLGATKLGQFFMASDPTVNGSTLGQPSDILMWSKGLQYYNYSQSTVLSSRGIAVDAVKTCTYDSNNDATSVATFYFNRPTVSMPAGDKMSLIVGAQVEGVDKSNPASPFNYRFSYDYTHFDFGIYPETDYHFQLDVQGFCKFPPSANLKPVPKLSDQFTSRLELITKENAGNAQETQTFDTFKFTFMPSKKLFVQESVSRSSGNNIWIQTERDVMVNDFQLGVQFELDRIRGGCQTSLIDPDNLDVTTVDKYVTINTAKQFFSLDSINYRYMGVRKDRGIDCDVWTNVFLDQTAGSHIIPNALYTWYFATEKWKAKNMFRMVDTALPVSMTIDQGKGKPYYKYNIYDYNTNFLAEIPDVSPCYNPDQVDNIQFRLDDSYSVLVGSDITAVREGLLAAMMVGGHLDLAPSRINSIDFYPWGPKTTQVLVRLLDITGLHGNVESPAQEPTNQEALQALRTKIDAGKFVVHIFWEGGDMVQTTAIPNSLAKFDPKQGKPDNTDVGSESSSVTYGVGEMAGLAVGMVALTLLITLTLTYLYRKYRLGGVSTDRVPMSRLSP